MSYFFIFFFLIDNTFVFIYVDWCLLILIDADWCWLMLIDADWCWLILIDANDVDSDADVADELIMLRLLLMLADTPRVTHVVPCVLYKLLSQFPRSQISGFIALPLSDCHTLRYVCWKPLMSLFLQNICTIYHINF